MGLVTQNDGWRMPDELWAKMEPLLPPRPPHPLGCHNPRTPDRRAMEGILLVPRTGMQWRALKATGIRGPSSAYRRFREWLEAGVFREFWRQGLLAYEALAGIDWKCPARLLSGGRSGGVRGQLVQLSASRHAARLVRCPVLSCKSTPERT